jgi:hypothetical protein
MQADEIPSLLEALQPFLRLFRYLYLPMYDCCAWFYVAGVSALKWTVSFLDINLHITLRCAPRVSPEILCSAVWVTSTKQSLCILRKKWWIRALRTVQPLEMPGMTTQRLYQESFTNRRNSTPQNVCIHKSEAKIAWFVECPKHGSGRGRTVGSAMFEEAV